ncbi:MAG: FAD-dependent oxidoreductase [Thermoplasmatales archaeon]|nr:FAD-dependent oxidoreductase [Thermoplasmatales archaeon]
MKIVIVGGGSAGATAAQFAKKTNRKAEVVLFDKEGMGLYSRCALPYVISGMDWKKIVELTRSDFEKMGISYRNEEIKRIDIDARIVEGEKEEEFDKLIIASGAKPSCPFKAENAYFLRNLNDAIEIRRIALNAKSAIVIGAGLVGIEIAEALKKIGIEVKILEYMPNILPNMLDKDVADYLMKKIGLDIVLNYKVEEVQGGEVFGEENYKSDFTVIATGNKPNGIIKDVIDVDEKCYFREDIYSAGDCTKVKDFFGRAINVGLGSIAVRQGMVAGINSAGGNESLIPPLFSKTTKVFGIEIASVGLMGSEGVSAKYIGKDLPNYMEGEEFLIKLVAKDGKIAGAQAVGRGAAKVIDRVAVAIYARMRVKDFAKIENAYAPSVAPVFDCLAIVSNILQRKVEDEKDI